MAEDNDFRCGYVAVVGRPNVGKSTYINRALGQKICITSNRPQTTRHRLLGINSSEAAQVIYVDTPGIHQKQHRAINRFMNREAVGSLQDTDVIVMFIEALKWTDEDAFVADKLADLEVPKILAVNKVDRVRDKARLLPFLQSLAAQPGFAEIVPLSARQQRGVNVLEGVIVPMLPKAAPEFPDDQVTNRDMRFFAAELIREKLMRRLNSEVPYRIAVEIEAFKETSRQADIRAVVWVEQQSQKGIIIGKQGANLKAVGSEARAELEEMLGKHVRLETWAKVKNNWSDDERLLRDLGYDSP